MENMIDETFKGKLKPCPFCGSKAVMLTDGEFYSVECSNLDCDIQPSTSYYWSLPEDAAKIWNNRQ